MTAKQISVFLENKSGRLASLTRTLSENGIDLIALSIADTTNFGILRAIVNDTDKAVSVLKEAGFTVNITNVLALEVPDKPGGLAGILNILDEKGIGVEYLYSFVKKSGENALIVFRVEDIEHTQEVLKENKVCMLSQDEIMARQ